MVNNIYKTLRYQSGSGGRFETKCGSLGVKKCFTRLFLHYYLYFCASKGWSYRTLTFIIHTRSYCKDQLAAPQRNARSSSLKVGFTTFCIVIAVLTLMHSHLALSLRNSMNNAG